MRTIEHGVLAACLLLAACGGGSAPVPAQPAPPPAELQAGDVKIVASAVNTEALPERVTKEYGIPRGEQTWMLLVTVHDARGASMPAKVTAEARTLAGNPIGIPMRETKTAGDYLDHIGTFSIVPPDTLAFTVVVTPQGRPASTLQFTREIAK